MVQTFGRTYLRPLILGSFGVLAVLGAGAAQAFTYATGDLVAVFVNSGPELEVDLGALSSLTNGKSFTFQAPPQFAGVGAIGGTFSAYEANAPFTGTAPRSVTFTTDQSVNPPSFDTKANYITKITPAQTTLDQGIAGAGWLPQLNLLPPAGMGGVILNTATELSLAASNVNSWTNIVGPNISSFLPFSTTTLLSGNGAIVPVWMGTRTSTSTAHTIEDGTLTVDGNLAGDGSTVGLTFNVIPEPGTMWLIASGLSGLVWAGRRQKERGAR
jgi:hypothetical protein